MTQEIQVNFTTDDNGMIGRECPAVDCRRYFKLRPGTGLNTNVTGCPYCGTKSAPSDFLTTDQKEYAISVAARDIVSPLFEKFTRNVERSNRRQPKGLIRLDISVRYDPVPLHEYVEKQLETEVTCDRCSLVFAIYGVFASCPDCGRLNALETLVASLETVNKKLALSKDESIDEDLRRDFLKDALNGPVGAFDSYGKAIRGRRAMIGLSTRSNLFQDIEALDVELLAIGLPRVEQLIGTSSWEEVKWFFQARHIYQHNAGVVDDKFVAKQPAYAYMLGQILPLDADRLRQTIRELGVLAAELDSRIQQ